MRAGADGSQWKSRQSADPLARNERFSVFLMQWVCGLAHTVCPVGDRVGAPVEPVDTAGAAETSPNFARNSPQDVLERDLKSAEYQRSGFNV